MITGSKISTPIHLDMILRSQRAIFGHRSYEHQLLFEEQFRDDTGTARCGIQDRRVKRTILNALHQEVSGIDMRAHGDFRAFTPHPEQPMRKEKRRVGTECVRQRVSRWTQSHYTTKNTKKQLQ